MGLQIGFMSALGIWGYPDTPEGGEVKEAPRKAILSLFFFETRPDNPIIQHLKVEWVDKQRVCQIVFPLL